MNRLSGIALVLAGLGVAVYALPSPNDTAPVASMPPQQPVEAKAHQARVVALPAPQEAAPSGEDLSAKPEARPVAKVPPPPAQAAQPLPRPAAKVVAQPTGGPTALPPPRMPVGQDTVVGSGPPLDRGGLTREIQRQLKRVGCYNGDINGVWTPSVRRSMKAFTDRVNATLPVEQPDYILLVIVQNHRDKACGQGCSPGENAAGDGRCVPKAIIALGAKKQAVPDAPSPAKVETTAAAAAAPLPEPGLPAQGRMALAGPQAAAETSAASATAVPLVQPGANRIGQQARPPRRTTYDDDAGIRDRRRYTGGTSNRFPNWAMKAFGQ